MKKSVLLSIIGVLLVIGVGITFAYFTSGVEVSGDGANVKLEPGDMIQVTYDAKDSSLSSNNLVPGETLTKTFSVTVTPTSKENTASYSIYFDITDNTFIKCDDSNYNSITNACIKDYEELTYEFKDNTGAILSSGNLIGESGRILLAAQTKTVDSETTYEYTMEITFHETNADQNHNMEKVLNGSIEVEFGMSAKEYILANEGGVDAIIEKGTPDFSQVATTDEGMYAAEDDWGTSFYYRGAVNDNWMQFGTNSSGEPLYWRIIRINGDGTIRLIYNGTSTTATGTTTQIQTSTFSIDSYTFNNNAYVGYMYELNNIHGLTTNSGIKTILDQWYQNNLADEAEYIEGSTGFCGDRTSYINASGTTSGGGTGTTTTYYGAYIRLYRSDSASNASPSLECSYEDTSGIKQDLYTTSGSGQGNQALIHPIGLITADEVAMAGGVVGSTNQSYYLYTGQYYWTLSPSWSRSIKGSDVFAVYSAGNLGYWGVYNYIGVRPTINIHSDFQITGTGSADDPYTLA